MATLFSVPLILTNFNLITVYITLGYLAFFIILEFVSPFIFHFKVKGYENKLLASQLRDKEVNIETLISITSRSIGKSNFILIFILFFVLFTTPLFQEVGKNKAAKQTEYLILIDTELPLLVVDIYRDFYILSEIDLENNLVSQEFQVVKKDDDSLEGKKFIYKKIGPVKVIQ